MGNGVGSILGFVAGAAIACIPGVGPIAAVGIAAATTTAGSGVDALVDSGKQNEEADKAAADARKKVAIEAEAVRVKSRKELEDQKRQANEALVAVAQEAKKQRDEALEEQERLENIALMQEEQINLIAQAITACAENTNLIAGILPQMDEQHFALFRERALAACPDADALEACRIAIEQEEMRRAVLNGWEHDIAAETNDAHPAPRQTVRGTL
jgi:hypothetical protein